MAQPIITMRNRGVKVVSGLLVWGGLLGLLLILLPGAGALPPAQAQEPDVSASAITQNVSANVSISHYPAVSGTQTFTYTRNVTPSITVRVSCWGDFYINVTVSLSGNVPLTVVYVPGGRTQSKSMTMSGSKTQSFYSSVCVSGYSYSYIVAPTVPVTGTVTVTAQSGETGAVITGNGTLSGVATIWVTGNARLITYAYLPLIARQEQPEGVYWSDDFSSDKGWQFFGCEDGCDCKMERKNERLRITLNTKWKRCFVAPPASVQLKEGDFRVKARRLNDNKTWYGLIFNASSELFEERWAVEARPFGGSGWCGGDEGLLWVSRINKKYDDICTDEMKLGTNEWNTLRAVRQGNNVKVYVNDSGALFDQNDGTYKNNPYFDLEVISEDKVPVVVEFDDFELRY
jgi:hypothetical protein